MPLLTSFRFRLVVATGVSDHATEVVEGHAVHATFQLDRDVVRCYVERIREEQHDIAQLADAEALVAPLDDACPDVGAANLRDVRPAGIVPAVANHGNAVVQFAAQSDLSINPQEV